jgi:hypothetical protein
VNPLSNPAQAQWPVVVNENFDALPNQVYAYDYVTSTGLTWGYFGGRWGGFSVAAATLSLTNAADNYIVVLRSSGAISVSTSTTNWNDTDAYARVFKVTTAGSAVTAVEDHRSGPGGVHGNAAAAGAGVELKGLRFTSDTGSTADSDPGAGLFKWNHAAQGSAGKLFIDDSTEDGVSLATYFGSLGQAGEIFIQQSDDADRWQLWRWTALANDTGYRDFTVTLQAKSASDIEDAKVCFFDFEEDDTGAAGTAGKHAIYIAAGAMVPSASGGCAPLATVASAANQPDITSLDFDSGGTNEYAQFGIVMPKSWNEGTLTFKAHWSHASGSGDVIWGLQAVAVSDDDAIATAFGTAQEVTDSGGTVNDLYTTAESSAITVAGSPAAEDMVFFRVYRNSASGSDTLAVDARLHGITLYITTDAENDA